MGPDPLAADTAEHLDHRRCNLRLHASAGGEVTQGEWWARAMHGQRHFDASSVTAHRWGR
jgi:hypothetical protein